MTKNNATIKQLTTCTALFLCCVIFSGGCGGWGGNASSAISGETVRPFISSVSPVKGAKGVAADHILTATFSAPMDPASIGQASFKLTHGYDYVDFNAAYFPESKTAFFSPKTPLSKETSYTATITALVKDSAGNSMADEFVWTFTTKGDSDKTAPVIISTVPEDKAIGVAVDQKISAKFNSDMDPATIGPASFILTQDGNPVPGGIAYDRALKTAYFVSNDKLENGKSYAAEFTVSVKDSANQAMADNYKWTFTTAAAVNDISGEYMANPAFDPDERAYYPSILFDGTQYRMWCDDGRNIRYSTSADGIKWAEGLTTNGLTNSRHPVVKNIEGRYMIWYWNTSPSTPIDIIRTAESNDGINWTSDSSIFQVGTTVIDNGWNHGANVPGDVLYNPAGSPTIVPPVNADAVWQNKFVMYYFGSRSSGIAVSSDGKLWHGYNDGVEPVLFTGEPGAWDDGYVTAGTVLKINETYHMWYSGGRISNNEGIGHAQSIDGVSWIKSSNNPLLHRDNGVIWRDTRTYTPMLIYDPVYGNGSPCFKMWYTGMDQAENYSIGYATLNFSGDKLYGH